MKAEFVELEVSAVKVKYRPRTNNGDLGTLQASVKRLGLLHPILVDRHNVLICGGRRLEACRAIGMNRLPALRLDIESGDLIALDIQSDENLCRLALSAGELDAHIKRKTDKAATPKWFEKIRSFFSKIAFWRN